MASSLALIDFGTVAVGEVFASAVVAWLPMPGHGTAEWARTTGAHRSVAIAFVILAFVLAAASVRDLAAGPLRMSRRGRLATGR